MTLDEIEAIATAITDATALPASTRLLADLITQLCQMLRERA